MARRHGSCFLVLTATFVILCGLCKRDESIRLSNAFLPARRQAVVSQSISAAAGAALWQLATEAALARGPKRRYIDDAADAGVDADGFPIDPADMPEVANPEGEGPSINQVIALIGQIPQILGFVVIFFGVQRYIAKGGGIFYGEAGYKNEKY
eukprot:TRINITY_DN50334_c0_g1_i1.p1 TRINITY_DN50334_c0_g1~~TRINITY_DN50334_c0_g1_i1.p1  ORF type:complete len:168 (+),score=28.42 TRINITY_DN50334_c0_g1_i1:47-505(+)